METEKASLENELTFLEADIAAQVATVIDAGATMRSLRRLGDVFDALDEVVDRRHLLATCFSRVVVRHDALELHVPAVRLLVEPAVSLNGGANVFSFIHTAPAGRPENGAKNRQNRADFPQQRSDAISEIYGIRERMDAHSFANTIVRRKRDGDAEPERELVITAPLPEDKGRQGDGRPRVHRFRSQQVELGVRLRSFRVRYALTQVEVARVLEVSNPTVCQWEAGVRVAEGYPRERLSDLVEGRLWPDLRSAFIAREGLPPAWREAARWYRRASRELELRESAGVVVAAILKRLAAVGSPDELRVSYIQRDGEWTRGLVEQYEFGERSPARLRRIEDAAFGLRWLELTQGQCFDLSRSLVPQFPLARLDAASPYERPVS